MSISADKMITGVFGIPVNSQRQLLMCQRHEPGNPASHGKWQFAGGGMEFGESPEETLVRELQEELSVTPTILLPQPIVKTYVWQKKQTKRDYRVHITLIFYLVSIGDQQVDITNNDENSGVGWFDLDQIGQLDTLPKVADVATEAYELAEKVI
jgi:mutator protein MutT